MNLKNSNIIQKFFNTYYWRQHPEAALRYFPVVSEIKKAKLTNSKILEIGPGSLGIVPYLKKPIDGIDVDFSGPKAILLNKIKGSAWDLPFRNKIYDVSISVDVLEHIEPGLRERAVFEMLRVTKQLTIIVVPCNEESEQQDKELQTHWNKTFVKKNQFLDEHVKYGLPKSDEILVYIDRSLRKLDKKAKIKSYSNLNLGIRKILMHTWITKSKYLYYLYLKGYLFLLPLLKLSNFGKTYRRVFVIKFSQ